MKKCEMNQCVYIHKMTEMYKVDSTSDMEQYNSQSSMDNEDQYEFENEYNYKQKL